MRKPKIDIDQLNQLLIEGKTVGYIAKMFSVSSAAVSKAKKKLKIGFVKNVTLERAHRVVDKNLNAVAQLQKINEYANELLDLLMRWNRGEDEALRIMESQVKKVKHGRGKDAEEITEYHIKDPRELIIRVMGEIRGQLSLQLDIFRTLYDMEAVAEFQKEVLDAIGEVDEETRNKIVERLKERRALRGTVTLD